MYMDLPKQLQNMWLVRCMRQKAQQRWDTKTFGRGSCLLLDNLMSSEAEYVAISAGVKFISLKFRVHLSLWVPQLMLRPLQLCFAAP